MCSYVGVRTGMSGSQVSGGVTLSSGSKLLLLALVITHTWSAIAELDVAERDQARTLYLEKCAACHGAGREGRAGSELFAGLMRGRGEASLKQLLHFGTSTGMPNWGTSEALGDHEMSLLARYLMQSDELSGVALEFSEKKVADSHVLVVAPENRPRNRENALGAEQIFVSLLHDTASIALIDGAAKRLITRIGVGLAPHAIALSPERRYLYVLGRGGELVMLDLFMRDPMVVARVRVGYESRALAVVGTGESAALLVAAQTPAQLVALDLQTLRVLSSISLVGSDGVTPLRVTQILAPPGSANRFAAISDSPAVLLTGRISRTGAVSLESLFPFEAGLGRGYSACGVNQVSSEMLLPVGRSKVAVVHMPEARLHAQLEPQGLDGPGGGVCFFIENRKYWVAGSMHGATAALLSQTKGTGDWVKHPPLVLGGAGTLFAAAHPRSDSIWLDHAASFDSAAATHVSVFRKSDVAGAVDYSRDSPLAAASLNLVRLAEMAGEPIRALHPQYNSDGSEIWFTLWNRQDRQSALVVLDAESYELVAKIVDNRLITPIRTFSLAMLR